MVAHGFVFTFFDLILINDARCHQMSINGHPLATQKVNFLAGKESKYYLLTYRQICTRSCDWLKWFLFIQV